MQLQLQVRSHINIREYQRRIQRKSTDIYCSANCLKKTEQYIQYYPASVLHTVVSGSFI